MFKNSVIVVIAATFSLILLWPAQPAQSMRLPTYIDTHMHLHVLPKKGGRSEIEPEYGVVLARHHHRGDRRRGPGPGRWPGDKPSKTRRSPAPVSTSEDYKKAAKILVDLMDRYGVETSLILPPPQYSGQRMGYDYNTLLPAIEKYRGRLALVAGGGILNPMILDTDPDNVTASKKREFEKEARKIVKAGAIGFGEMAAMHICMSELHNYTAYAPDHPLVLLLADIAAETGLAIDWHMEAVPEDMPLPAGVKGACSKNPSTIKGTIEPFERLLAHNRKTKIVWQHIGWDNTGHMKIELLRKLLDKHPNLYMALRVEERLQTQAGTPMPNRIVDRSWKIKSEWLMLINDFPDRFMIGGDEFVGDPGRSRKMPQSFAKTWTMVEQLPDSVRNKVGRDNAAMVYNLR